MIAPVKNLGGRDLLDIAGRGSEGPRASSISDGKLKVSVTGDIHVFDRTTAMYAGVWASMGQESEKDSRLKAVARYQVKGALMDLAPDATTAQMFGAET